jgi:uncharacterized protein
VAGDAVTPMFPLGTVLLPGGVLPLHVFEPRYQALVADCMAADGTFAVVLISRGHEVGGGDVRTDVGTLARIVAAQPQGAGRWYLITVGTERVRVAEWLEDDPYPRARTEAWPDPVDDEAPSSEEYQALLVKARRALALAAEVGLPAGDATTEFPDEPVLGTYQVAGAAPLGPHDRQRLLATEGARARLALLDAWLDDLVETIELRLAEDAGDDGGA